MNDQPFSLDAALTAIPEPGPERDKTIAQTWMEYSIYHYDKDVPERCYYMLVDNDLSPVAKISIGGNTRLIWPERKTEVEAWADCPRFSEDIAAAYQMEEVIAKKGRTATYGQALAVVMLENKIPQHEEEMWFLFAHATPEQRSKAALVTWVKVQAHKEKKDE